MTDLLTSGTTAIVLDSTCDPPPGFFERPGLYMVPLKVHFGDETFRDGVDMTYLEFFAKLEASEVLPTTSQPTAAEFLAAYREARQTYDHVFSLHISGEMSGTVRSAQQAAEQIDGVEVYDLRTVATGIKNHVLDHEHGEQQQVNCTEQNDRGQDRVGMNDRG